MKVKCYKKIISNYHNIIFNTGFYFIIIIRKIVNTIFTFTFFVYSSCENNLSTSRGNPKTENLLNYIRYISIFADSANIQSSLQVFQATLIETITSKLKT